MIIFKEKTQSLKASIYFRKEKALDSCPSSLLKRFHSLAGISTWRRNSSGLKPKTCCWVKMISGQHSSWAFLWAWYLEGATLDLTVCMRRAHSWVARHLRIVLRIAGELAKFGAKREEDPGYLKHQEQRWHSISSFIWCLWRLVAQHYWAETWHSARSLDATAL